MPHEADFPSDLRALESEYELIRELGQGGTTAVYLARHRTTGQLVAIKAIRARYLDDEDALKRFALEARTVADLDHPNIVRTHAVRRIDDRAVAIIMEHVAGGTVRDRLREHGSLGAEHAESVLRDVASALRYAHQRGIVHRDVKPENIFLDAHGWRALLSDFGIARHVDGAGITLLGAALGTPQYMSPEQIDGEKVDGRSDIYSLGVLGWELLTGRRPWAGESLYGVIYKQKHEDLPRITSLRPRVPANLLFAVEGALVKDRTRRWQTVDEFLNQLTYNPPPVLAQPFPASMSPPADEPTVRFRPQEVEPPSGHDGVTAPGTAELPPAIGAPLLPSATEPPVYAAADRFDSEHAIAQHAISEYAISEYAASHRDAGVESLAGAGLAGTSYGLPDFGISDDADESARIGRGRVGRALALLVPLAIAGASLFVVLGGRAGQPASNRSGSGVLTSSSGSLAAEDLNVVDAGSPPRTVPTLPDGNDAGARPNASGGSSAVTGSPQASPREGPTGGSIGGGDARRAHGTAGPTIRRTGRSRREFAEGTAPLGGKRATTRDSTPSGPVAGAGDARPPREAQSDPARADSAVMVPAALVLEDPFRPPTSPAPGMAGAMMASPARVGRGRGGAAAWVPSPRCLLAASADQRACLEAYVAEGDVAMERAFDALVGELRRLGHPGPGEPDPPSVTRLRVEQRAWLSVRNAECPRGPAASTDPFWAESRSRCFTEMSASRARELQEAVRRLGRK